VATGESRVKRNVMQVVMVTYVVTRHVVSHQDLCAGAYRSFLYNTVYCLHILHPRMTYCTSSGSVASLFCDVLK